MTGRVAELAPRVVRAANPSPLTLDGTRTHLVGRARVAVIDPGPASDEHLAALLAEIGDAAVTAILLTHTHPDHAAGAHALAARVQASVHAAAAGTLAPGERMETDEGDLVAVPTPGHAPDHFAFHWPSAAAVFCGDLLVGGQPTTLVAPPEGDLAAYLASLDRVAALAPGRLYPAHGPPFDDPAAALTGYRLHRRERLDQLLGALAEGPVDVPGLVQRVYGPTLDGGLLAAARGATRAYLEFLQGDGAVARLPDGRWARRG
jgi:glyoxylase-like metal-dependent hydrolase (beta-lactamase superfamily II)